MRFSIKSLFSVVASLFVFHDIRPGKAAGWQGRKKLAAAHIEEASSAGAVGARGSRGEGLVLVAFDAYAIRFSLGFFPFTSPLREGRF